MKKITNLALGSALALSMLCGSQVFADGIVDGSIGSNYIRVGTQTVQTGFGDQDGTNAGSEIDAAYAYCANGRLYMGFAGNLEENFNKLEIFFDTRAGGEMQLSAAPDYDFDTGGGNWNSSNLGGMTFDTGFAADYHMFVRSGGGGNFEVDFIDRLGGTSSAVNGNGGTGGVVSAGSVANGAVGGALGNDIFYSFNNSNLAGIIGGDGAANQAAAEAVMTGYEFSIALSDLGITDPSVANTFRIAAMIGNSDHHYLSNQILGGLAPPQGNLGGDGAGGFIGDLSGINFNDFAGVQYMEFTLPGHAIPEPGSMAVLFVAGGLALVRRRR